MTTFGIRFLDHLAPARTLVEHIVQVHMGPDHRRGHAHVDIAGCGWFSVAEDVGAAQEVIRLIAAYFGPHLEEEALNTIGLPVRDFAPVKERMGAGDCPGAAALVTDRMLDLAVVGTPTQIIPRLDALVEAGITQIPVGGPLGPDPRRAIELPGDQVLPHFR